MKKTFYITYEAETPKERNFEIKVKKWGDLGYFAVAHVYEVIRPERKFFGRCKWMGKYVYDLDFYDSLEEVAQTAVIKAMSVEEREEKIKNMWKGQSK